MSIFDWEERKESKGQVASKWIWLYFAISIPLTAIVFAFWWLWYRQKEKKYRQYKESLQLNKKVP